MAATSGTAIEDTISVIWHKQIIQVSIGYKDMGGGTTWCLCTPTTSINPICHDYLRLSDYIIAMVKQVKSKQLAQRKVSACAVISNPIQRHKNALLEEMFK